MKKLVFLLVGLIYMSSISITALAEEPAYESMKELYKEWNINGYPDYVCGVWSNDGAMDKLIVAIQDTEEGNIGKQEILDSIRRDYSVQFVYMQYSKNFLEKIKEELVTEMALNCIKGLRSISIDEQKNVLEVGIQETYCYDPAVLDLIEEYTTKYEDAIKFTYGNASALYAPDFLDNNYGQSPTCVPCVIVIGGIIAVIVLLIVVKQPNLMVLQTNHGRTMNALSPLKIKEVENMITKSNFSLSTDFDEKMISTIEKVKR